MRRGSIVLAAVLTLGMLSLSSFVRADLVISVDSLTLAPGGTGTLDVNINSTNPLGDNLDTFGFEFQITTSRPTVLEFVSTQPNPYSNSSYVFFNNSLNQGPPVFALGTVSSVGAQSNTYIGGDGTVTGSADIGSPNQLLLQLSVTAATGALSPVPGNTFTISLIPGANTSFSDNGTGIPFTSTAGTVTISPASVPEPEPLVLLGFTVLIGTSYGLVTRRGDYAPAV